MVVSESAWPQAAASIGTGRDLAAKAAPAGTARPSAPSIRPAASFGPYGYAGEFGGGTNFDSTGLGQPYKEDPYLNGPTFSRGARFEVGGSFGIEIIGH